jgi:hypothetical protein
VKTVSPKEKKVKEMNMYELFKAQVFGKNSLPEVVKAVRAAGNVEGEVFNFAVTSEDFDAPASAENGTEIVYIVTELAKALEHFGTVNKQEIHLPERPMETYYWAEDQENFIQASMHIVLDAAEPVVWVHFAIFLASPGIFNR